MLAHREIHTTSNMTSHWQSATLNILDDNGATIFDLLLYTLRTRQPEQSHHRNVLRNRTHDIMDLWSEQYPTEVEGWAMKAGIESYHAELLQLIHPHAGFHFRGTRASLDQLESFSMVEMGKKIKELAPNLWTLLGVLLDADPA